MSSLNTFQTWKEAVAALRESSGGSSAAQLALADKLEFRLAKNVPRLVAAARLRIELADELQLETREATDGQMAYLRLLAEELDLRFPSSVVYRDEAEAWIETFHAKRSLRALRRIKVNAGDVVAPLYGGMDSADEVASIHRSGRLYFRGGRGAGIRPHLVEVLARAGATDAKSAAALKIAQNRVAARNRLAGPPTRQRLSALEAFEVRDAPRREVIDELEDVISTAADEAPIQKFLGAHPELLGDLRVSSHGTYVRSLPRLGSQYIPDFVLAIADSAGIHYVLVELESPRARMAVGSGQFANKAREAIAQIEDWREWLKNNLAYAQRDAASDGLGLPEIRPESPGLVIIGRRSDTSSTKNEIVRQRLIEKSNIAVHSYDWLVESLRPGVRRRHALGPLEIDLEPERSSPFEFDLSAVPEGGSPFAN